MIETNVDMTNGDVPAASLADPLEQLLDVVVGKEQSLERLLHLVQLLDEKGFLRQLEYLVNDFEDLVDAGIKAAVSPKALKLLEAGSSIKEAMGSVDVSALPQIVKKLNGLFQGMSQSDSTVQVRGLFDIVKLLKDPDIRTALSVLFSSLKSFGKAASASSTE